MRRGFMHYSVLQEPRCFKDFEHSRGKVYGISILRSLATKAVKRIGNATSSRTNNLRNGLLDETTSKTLLSNRSTSTLFDNAQQTAIGSQKPKHLAKVFIMDIETTGFCRKKERIVDFAIRDISGGENSYLQTLVNPERNVPNSDVHGITTKMVNHPHVPRMKDLIPILMEYIRNRQIPGGPALLVAHNGRCFDFPFLSSEFSRCTVDIPCDWLFLDTLSLARELMRSNASKLPSGISLQALQQYYDIPLVGEPHRAITDVNSLALILEGLTFQLKLSINDLLARSRSFKALEMVNLKHTKKMY